MRWFKHFTDNHRGRSVQHAIDQMGHAALSIYTIMEICAEKLDAKPDSDLAGSDCVFSFHPAHFQSVLRMKSKSARLVLGIFQESGWLKFSYSENEVRIEMPMLLDLLEYDQKKSRQRRAVIAPKKRLEKRREEKSREEGVVPSGTTTAVAENSSPAVVVRLPKKSQIKDLEPQNETEMLSGLSPKTLARWAKLYSDPDFLRRESIKAFGYYENNPLKTPKTVRGWTQALSTWFERAWPRHVAQIQSVTNAGLTESQFNDLVAGGDK